MQMTPDSTKIKRWREERAWSQEHLADAAGIGLRTIQRIENGEKASRETVMALAAAFGVDVLALTVDPQAESAKQQLANHAKAAAGLRLSFWINLASFGRKELDIAETEMVAGGDGFVMKWPLIWWAVGVAGHGLAVVIVELVSRFNQLDQT